MNCEQCGQPLQSSDAFCRNCGHSLPQQVEPALQEIATAQAEVEPIPAPVSSEQKTRKIILLITGIIALLCIAYFSARAFLLGPTTPEAAQEQFVEALHTRNMDKLAALIDPNEKQLTDPKTLAAFKASLTPEILNKYQKTLQESTLKASEKGGRQSDFAAYGDSWLSLLKKKSFLGTSWSVHINPVAVKVKKVTDTNLKVKVGDISADGESLGLFWPSIYTYEAEASNPYATTKTKDKIDLLTLLEQKADTDTYEVDPTPLFKQMRITFPDTGSEITDLSVTINGKALNQKSGQLLLLPAPDKADFDVKMKVAGQNVERKFTVIPQQQEEINLNDVTNEANEEVLAIQNQVYTTLDEYIRYRIDAINYNNFSQIATYLVPNTKLFATEKEIVDTYSAKGISESLLNYNITNIQAVNKNTYTADVYKKLQYNYVDGTSEVKDFSFRFTMTYNNGTVLLTDRVDLKK
ncbi:TcaA NTF2-like domain-containing protein [Aneurinibacillus uraniidurans]|uniref:TcaA NTF2-like domain-containing protein n=1 Tax=Aneurinibacillus uraniidurans TaxID=2966586 RepID=UPI00234AE817|nr:hypothetical protein [Aneurinibacillus sp. B1]WCN37961.1 hypothetical protein PO771_00545 [Aneurinibacillus sp. B1]